MISAILGGASTSSAEAIGLNLQRALKIAGLTKHDMANMMQAQKAIAALEPDPKMMANLLLTERAISANGVPAVEIARVLGDGVMSKDLFQKLSENALAAIEDEFRPSDVETMVRLYEQLGLKSNLLEDVIDHIDRNLIQVRCSLEDVAENHVNSMLSRGEKETMISR